MKKQILAMGGGGFSMEPENLKLDSYLLSLYGASRPKVCSRPRAKAYRVQFDNTVSETTIDPELL